MGTFLNTNLISLKNKTFLFYLLALSGLFLRGLYLFEYSHFANFDLAIGADVGEYASRAKEIMQGKFFPDSPEIHAPLYSFFLAFLQKIGLDIVGIRIFQTFLNYFAWIALYFLIKKIKIRENICFIFLGLSMILAPVIFHPAELVSESLLLPLFAGVFYLLFLSEDSNSPQKKLFPLGAGVLSALTLLTHGMSIAFIFFQTLYFAWQKTWLRGALFAAGVLLIILPFFAVKSSFYGKFTGIQANTGFNIFLGNNPKATGLCYMRPGNTWRKEHVQAQRSAEKRGISTDRFWLEKAFHFWKTSPWAGIKLYCKKIPLIFSGRDHIAGADGGFLFCRTAVMNLLRFLTFPVFILAFYGLAVICKKREPLWSAPLILALGLLLMQIVTVTSGRYRLLMFPAVIYLAAAGGAYLNWRKWIWPFLILLMCSVWFTYNFMGSNKAEATALLGEAHFIKGNYEHAEELLLFAQKRFKDSARIENMLGNIAEKHKNFPRARYFYAKAAQAESFMPEAWMNLANITSDPKAAEKYFKRALEAAAPSPGADLTFNYAKFLHAAKRSREAEKFLQQTLATASDHVMALNLSGIIAFEKKDFSSASQFFFRAAELNPKEIGFWRNCAIAARLAGNAPLEQHAIKKFQESQPKKGR